MAITAGEADWAVELFSELGEITTRRMMGGLCLYHDGLIFAILHPSEGLLLKATGDLIAEIEAEGGTRWRYARPGRKETAMPYWSLPATAQDDPEEASRLARRALELLRAAEV